MAAKKAKPVEKKLEYNRAENIICRSLFNLNDDEQNEIRKSYLNYRDFVQLARDIYQDPTIDENSEEYKAIKNFTVRLYNGVTTYNFSEDQINFIADSGEDMTPAEIARALFPDRDGGLSLEIKTIVSLLKAFQIEYKGKNAPQTDNAGPYVPPHTDHKIIALINRAIPSANYSLGNLDSEKRRCIAALKSHLCSHRFVAMATVIRSKRHRDVFQNEFIKAVADKPDLVSEEINAYMNLANEYVLSILITEQISDLNDRLKEATSDDEEGRKFTKNISDSLSTKTGEYHSCQQRMMKLHDDLAGKRSDRLKNTLAASESLSKFIELAKNEEGRKYMLKLAELRNADLQKEATRIQGLDDLVMEIKGVSIEEILNF